MSDRDKSLMTSLLLCLGEWCMRLGPSKLLDRNDYNTSYQNKEKCLLLSVFQVCLTHQNNLNLALVNQARLSFLNLLRLCEILTNFH